MWLTFWPFVRVRGLLDRGWVHEVTLLWRGFPSLKKKWLTFVPSTKHVKVFLNVVIYMKIF
jgi:hypothetical protein